MRQALLPVGGEQLGARGEFVHVEVEPGVVMVVAAWMLEVQLSKRNSPGSRQEGTTTYEFDSALASKHLTGAHDVKRC